MLSDQVVLILDELNLEITEDIFNYLYDNPAVTEDFGRYVLSNRNKKPLVRVRFYELKRMVDDSLSTVAEEVDVNVKVLPPLSASSLEKGSGFCVNATSSLLINRLSNTKDVTGVSISGIELQLVDTFRVAVKPSVQIVSVMVYDRDIWASSKQILSSLLQLEVEVRVVDKIKSVIYSNPTVPMDFFNHFLVTKYLGKYGEGKYLSALDNVKETNFKKIANPLGYFLTMLER